MISKCMIWIVNKSSAWITYINNCITIYIHVYIGRRMYGDLIAQDHAMLQGGYCYTILNPLWSLPSLLSYSHLFYINLSHKRKSFQPSFVHSRCDQKKLYRVQSQCLVHEHLGQERIYWTSTQLWTKQNNWDITVRLDSESRSVPAINTDHLDIMVTSPSESL